MSITVAFDGNHDEVKIANAIQADTDVILPAGKARIQGVVPRRSGVRVHGSGMGRTILEGGVPYDNVFADNLTNCENFILEDFTIDVQNADHASAYRAYYAKNCITRRIEFKNVPAGGWSMQHGVFLPESEGILNINNKIEDCVFDGHAGSLEMLLLFNCQDTEIIRPIFKNKSTVGPMVGLWQKTSGTKMIRPMFLNSLGFCVYYSITCDDTLIEDMYVNNCAHGIQGSNISDWGDFGLAQANGLRLVSPQFIGGVNSRTSTAIQLGAIDNVVISNPFIEGYEIGVMFDNGNNSANAAATNWLIENPEIKNGNPNNDYPLLHPGILFKSIGGAMHGRITGGKVYNDATTPGMTHPVVFDGAHNWDKIELLGTELYPEGNNPAVKLNNGATLGSGVVLA